VVLIALLLAGPASSLQYDNGGVYDASRHERFVPGTFAVSPVANPSFYLADYASDLRAVGWKTSNPSLKVTLVTPQHFLNADHWKATGSVSFVDAAGNIRTYSIAKNEAVRGDLAVGTLVAPIPPEDGINYLPIASFARSNHVGREVHYVGNTPGGAGFAFGRSAISGTSTNSVWLDNDLVEPQFAGDRVFGVTGDSGAPSLFAEVDGLSFVSTHYTSLTDQVPGTKAARAILDDYLAADGQLLDVYGEGRLGDPASGDWVVTGVAEDLGIHFDATPGETEVVDIRIHDFSGNGTNVEVDVTGSEFAVRVPGFSNLLQQLAITVPADGTGATLEVVFTPTGSGSSGSLQLTGDGTVYTIPLDNDAPDLGMRPASILASPAYQAGLSGSGSIPSDTRTFTLDVTNNDVGGTSATFDYAAECPFSTLTGCSNGWNIQFFPPLQTIAAGDTATVNVQVTPAQDIPVAIYSIDFTGQDPSAPIHDASAGTFYWVNEIASDLEPPTAPTNLWATGDTSSVTLTWDPSQDDTGVAQYLIERDGKYRGGAFTESYTDTRTRRNTTHVYVVRAQDAAGRQSPPSASISLYNGVVVGGGGDPGDTGAPVCVPTRSNEKGKFCRDGEDNDCDGSIDAFDPDC